MTPQKKPIENALLAELEKTPDTNLESGVEKTEGVNGSTVEPIYSARKMRCYSVTESELKQIGLANIGITAFSSIGTGLLAFWLDIFKDTVLAGGIPDTAKVAVSIAEPILLVGGVVFWIFAIVAIFWRQGMLKLIKSESTNP